jgi:hypothetical protein
MPLSGLDERPVSTSGPPAAATQREGLAAAASWASPVSPEVGDAGDGGRFFSDSE